MIIPLSATSYMDLANLFIHMCWLEHTMFTPGVALKAEMVGSR
jgi:hypothetical protein